MSTSRINKEKYEHLHQVEYLNLDEQIPSQEI
jgi:hypothetical protein